MIIWYGLDHQPIDAAEANELLVDIARRRVAMTEVGEVAVSTVFLVLDHNCTGDGPPVLYETMVLGGPHDQRQWRYPTREAALAGHDQAVTLVRDPDASGGGGRGDDRGGGVDRVSADLPPGFEIVLTDGRRKYVIEAAGQPARARDKAVAEAWADIWRRAVNTRLRPEVAYLTMVDVDKLDVPESVAAGIRRFLAMRDAVTASYESPKVDDTDAYLRHYPEHGDAVRRALTTGDLSAVPDLTDPVWRDDAYEYRFRGSDSSNTSVPRLVRARRPDRRFRYEFAGRFERYPEIERKGGNDIGPTFAVGGRDVVAELSADDRHRVRVTIDGNVVGAGALRVWVGNCGYSALTPGDSDVFDVGDVDLLVMMLAYEDGAEVTLIVEQDG